MGSGKALPLPQVGLLHLGVFRELPSGPIEDDLPRGEDVPPVGDLEGEAGVLLHEEEGHPLPLEGGQGAEDLLDDEGREAQGRLVQEEEAGPGHEGPTDGELSP